MLPCGSPLSPSEMGRAGLSLFTRQGTASARPELRALGAHTPVSRHGDWPKWSLPTLEVLVLILLSLI